MGTEEQSDMLDLTWPEIVTGLLVGLTLVSGVMSYATFGWFACAVSGGLSAIAMAILSHAQGTGQSER